MATMESRSFFSCRRAEGAREQCFRLKRPTEWTIERPRWKMVLSPWKRACFMLSYMCVWASSCSSWGGSSELLLVADGCRSAFFPGVLRKPIHRPPRANGDVRRWLRSFCYSRFHSFSLFRDLSVWMGVHVGEGSDFYDSAE